MTYFGSRSWVHLSSGKRWLLFIFACGLLLTDLTSCRKPAQDTIANIPPGVAVRDVNFYSDALSREVTYRFMSPIGGMPEKPLVVYLLHGNGSGFREWSQWSTVAQLAKQGYVLVMPEGHSTYFMNSASQSKDRYEDFLIRDLIRDAEKNLPTPPDRAHRAIAGVSMGGFAAVTLGLKHPELYGFAGALSPPIDAAERRFTLRRLSQSMGFRSIFGPTGSDERRDKDPFVLARSADPQQVPYIFLSVGAQESLAEPVRRFDALLTRRHLAHEFHTLPGGHDWSQWNRQLPSFEAALAEHEP